TTPLVTDAAVPAPAGDGKLLVSVTPYGNFIVDGQPRSQNTKSWSGALAPGVHKVRVEHPTLGAKDWDIELAAGESKELEYDFLAAGTGSISVASEGGWAEIYLDGDKTGHTTPFVLTGVLPGKHEVSVVREGFSVAGGANTVNVKAGQQVSVSFKVKQKK
ncbi:MAG: PEGA domain-containing protein, partial [Candidatus Eisenbacteria bacterium]